MAKSEKSIPEIFEAFNNLNVLVIGDVMIDAYMWGDVNRISPEAPVPVVSITKKEKRLGGAANVALNLQAMGAKPYLCSIIGDDRSGYSMTSLMNTQKISERGIIKSKDRITTIKTRIIGQNHQMLRVDEEIESELTSTETKQLIEKVHELINDEKIDAIIFEDYNKGCINKTIIEAVIELSKVHNIPTVVDPKLKNFLDFKGVTLFKPNLKELKEGLKIEFDHKNIDDLTRISTSFLEEQNIDQLLITLSESGIYTHTKESNSLIPAHIRRISDVSGAGDTVISVAALCLALNLHHEKIATLANLSGGLVCEKIGVVPIDKQKLLDEAIRLKL